MTLRSFFVLRHKERYASQAEQALLASGSEAAQF